MGVRMIHLLNLRVSSTVTLGNNVVVALRATTVWEERDEKAIIMLSEYA